jgi:DNA polymerase-3 subunit epsilon
MPYELTTVVGAKTSKGDLYLRFSARTGESVAVFSSMPLLNALMRLYPECATLQADQRLTWEAHPICVEMYKDAKGYWQISQIFPRGENAVPDVPFTPDKDDYRAAAVRWAKDVVAHQARVAVFDLETTTNDKLKAEPISVGLYRPSGNSVLMDTLIQPIQMSAVTQNTEAAAVHKITPDMLANAPAFRDVYVKLSSPLLNSTVLGYNVGFDLTVLHRSCARHGLVPLLPVTVLDAVEPVAWFMGEWSAAHQSFTYKSLEDAAAHFGLEFGDAHNALADCRMTWRVIEAMAQS